MLSQPSQPTREKARVAEGQVVRIGRADMSLWIDRNGKGGRREIWLVPFEPMSVVFVIGLIFTLYAPRLMRATIVGDAEVLLGLGFALFIASKISLFRRGIWLSWGSSRMTTTWRRAYRLGYASMLLGALMIFLAA